MKERIVLEKHEMYKLLDCLPMPMITDEDLEKQIKEGRKVVLFGKERKTEKIPESWEELKELCKDIKGISFGKDGLTEETEYICINDSVYFSITGEICFGIEPFAENRTPQQMWQIIKSLIGEE